MTTTIVDEKSVNVINAGQIQSANDMTILSAPMNGLIFEDKALEVGKCLVTSGAYGVMFALPPNKWLKWKNGTIAPVYCDCRALNALPLERKLVSATLAESVKRHFAKAEVVVGMATAGISWARVVADELDLPFAYVRSHTKGHGTGNLIEGAPPSGKKAVLVDDLVASGGSIQGAIYTLRNEVSIDVIGVQSIVNWGFDSMRRNLAGYYVKALTSYQHILIHALVQGIIDKNQFLQLLDFYNDPIHFQWPQLAREDDPLQQFEE